MKKPLPSLLLAAFTLMGGSSYAQTTMTYANFQRMGTFDHSLHRDESNVALPSLGSGQSWDYSGLTAESSLTHPHTAVSGDATFTTSNNYSPYTGSFQGMVYHSDHFESIDANSWTKDGRRIEEVGFSLLTMTGGANDSLSFPAYDDVFTLTQLQFPAAYGNSWSSVYETRIQYVLTVGAYGLDHVPGEKVGYFTSEYEVVGDGSLVIPLNSGGPAPALDVILVRNVETWIDSTFLAGSPAPTPLMNAFGLVQGDVGSDTTYLFYTPNLTSEVLTVGIPNALHTTNWAQYSGDAQFVGVKDQSEQMSLNGYPNPVLRGGDLHLNFEKPVVGTVNLVSMTGQLVHTQALSGGTNNVSVAIPESLRTGLYCVQVITDDAAIKPQLIEIQ